MEYPETHIDDLGGWKEGKTRTGSTVRIYVCPHCTTEYFARLDRVATVPVEVGMTEAWEKARRRADLKAEDKLFERLQNGIDPVACPECGQLSDEMLAEVRRRGTVSAGSLMGWRLNVGGLLCSFTVYALFAQRQFGNDTSTRIFVSAMACVAFVIGLVFLYLAYLQSEKKQRAKRLTVHSREVFRAARQAESLLMTRERSLAFLDRLSQDLEDEREKLASKPSDFAARRSDQLQRRLDALAELKQRLQPS
jgi:hypothetical protein